MEERSVAPFFKPVDKRPQQNTKRQLKQKVRQKLKHANDKSNPQTTNMKPLRYQTTLWDLNFRPYQSN
eukprot:10408738-Ditylum_brightwellii.AAC.1